VNSASSRPGASEQAILDFCMDQYRKWLSPPRSRPTARAAAFGAPAPAAPPPSDVAPADDVAPVDEQPVLGLLRIELGESGCHERAVAAVAAGSDLLSELEAHAHALAGEAGASPSAVLCRLWQQLLTCEARRAEEPGEADRAGRPDAAPPPLAALRRTPPPRRRAGAAGASPPTDLEAIVGGAEVAARLRAGSQQLRASLRLSLDDAADLKLAAQVLRDSAPLLARVGRQAAAGGASADERLRRLVPPRPAPR